MYIYSSYRDTPLVGFKSTIRMVASTKESEEEGGAGTGAPGGLNPGSSNEYSLITVIHKRGHDGGGQ